jgi:hypothetical protein
LHYCQRKETRRRDRVTESRGKILPAYETCSRPLFTCADRCPRVKPASCGGKRTSWESFSTQLKHDGSSLPRKTGLTRPSRQSNGARALSLVGHCPLPAVPGYRYDQSSSRRRTLPPGSPWAPRFSQHRPFRSAGPFRAAVRPSGAA